jgi:hypothetical protein
VLTDAGARRGIAQQIFIEDWFSILPLSERLN